MNVNYTVKHNKNPFADMPQFEEVSYASRDLEFENGFIANAWGCAPQPPSYDRFDEEKEMYVQEFAYDDPEYLKEKDFAFIWRVDLVRMIDGEEYHWTCDRVYVKEGMTDEEVSEEIARVACEKMPNATLDDPDCYLVWNFVWPSSWDAFFEMPEKKGCRRPSKDRSSRNRGRKAGRAARRAARKAGHGGR